MPHIKRPSSSKSKKAIQPAKAAGQAAKPISTRPADVDTAQRSVYGMAAKQRWSDRLKIILPIALIVAIVVIMFQTVGPNGSIPSAAQSIVSSNGSQDFRLAPRFSSVYAYTAFHGAEWYAIDGGVARIQKGQAPVYYAQREGVPSGLPTALAVHGGKLWLSTQYGLAILNDDGSAFHAAAAPNSLTNGRLFLDSAANKLYLSTFNDFYVFDDDTSNWNTMPGGSTPRDASYFAAGNDYLVASANGDGMPVWVYSKAAKTWSLRRPAGLGDGMPMVFNADGQLFVMGRNKGYNSCEQSGNLTASVAYRLDEHGAWSAQDNFNGDKSRPELNLANHVKDPAVSAVTAACQSKGQVTRYDLHYRNGALSLDNQRKVSAGSSAFIGDDGEQQTLVAQLGKVTGLYPFIRVLAVDKQSNLVFGYNRSARHSTDNTFDGIAVASGSDLARSRTIPPADGQQYDVLSPVMCGGNLRYLFAGNFDDSGGEGPAFSQWSTAKLFKVDDHLKVTPFADIDKDVSSTSFACGVNSVSWLARDQFKQLNTNTRQVSAVGPAISSNSDQPARSVYALPNGDIWALVTIPSDKANPTGDLYYLASKDGQVSKIDNIPGVALLGGTANQVWVADGYRADSQDSYYGLTTYTRDGAGSRQELGLLRLAIAGDRLVTARTLGKQHLQQQSVPAEWHVQPLAGGDNALPSTSSPAKAVRLSLGTSVGDTGSGDTGVYDAARNRIWFGDDQLGSFTVDLSIQQ